MPTVDYLPVATGAGANVDTQANFAGSGYQSTGFQTGLAKSKQANKVWRQASMMAAALANVISQILNISVLDDGNLTNLIANLLSALRQITQGLVVVPFSATPVFDASKGTSFEITLTGNVMASTLINPTPGQIYLFCIHQDGTGGRTFTWPGTVPGATIDPGVSATSIQRFFVDNGGVIHPATPMTVS